MFKPFMIWFNFTRPKTLVASILPIAAVVPFALRSPEFSWFRGGCFLIASLVLQIACNFTNDYYDFKRGSDREDRLGPRRVLQQGLLSLTQVKSAIILTYLVAFLFTLYLGFLTHPLIWLVGTFSIIMAFLYTGGKYPIAYHGLGEVTAFICFGPVIVLTAFYIMSKTFTEMLLPKLTLSLVYGSFSYILISINNLRDAKADADSKKHTLTVQWGSAFTRYSIGVGFGLIAVMTALLGYSERNLGLVIPVLWIIGAGVYMMKVLTQHSPQTFTLLLSQTGIIMSGYTLSLLIVLL